MKEIAIEKIIEILNSNIKGNEITIEQTNENLSNLGMDSISFIQIIVALEETFGCEIPDSKLLITEMDTAQKMFDVLQELYNTQPL